MREDRQDDSVILASFRYLGQYCCDYLVKNSHLDET